MLQLFASILRRDSDNEYYLVTPAEKVRIQVEDCPFLVVLLDSEGSGEQQQIRFTTNTDESFLLDVDHSLLISTNPATGEPHPIVHVRSGLNGLLGRNVFYQLVELAEVRLLDGESITGVWSCGKFFPLEGEQEASV